LPVLQKGIYSGGNGMRKIKNKNLLSDDMKAVLDEKEQRIFNNYLKKMGAKSKSIKKGSEIAKILDKLIKNKIFIKEAQNYEKLNRRVLKEIGQGISATLKRNGFDIMAKEYGDMMKNYPEVEIFSPNYWIMNVLELTDRDIAMFHLGEIALYLKSKGHAPDAPDKDKWPLNERKFKDLPKHA
jgi:hypothetical protein